MNPLTSMRRVAIGAALAGTAFGAAPALAGASPCTYNPATKVASVVDASGVNQLRVGVNGNQLFTQDGGNTAINCAGGGTVATTANTDRINVFAQAKGASDGVVLDQARGAFAPGATPEADGSSEIELALSGQSGHLSVFGTPGADVMRVRAVDRVGTAGALGLGADDDDDVTFAASDVCSRAATAPTSCRASAPASIPCRLGPRWASPAAPGDDVIFGGLGVDHFAGNAGADSLHSDDGNAELVSGGPDVDSAIRDGADTLFNVESSELGRVGRLALSPRTVNADARKWAKTTLRWTHPKSWRELRELELTLYRGEQPVGTIDVRPHGKRLAARGAVEIMANRSLVTHSAKTVSARLGMKFPRSLAGARLRIAVQAVDRGGHAQVDSDAGLIRIAEAPRAAALAALPQTCLKDGVCFSRQLSGANTRLTVTGTAGDDSIVVAHANPTSNNVGSGGITVDGKLVPGVSEGARLTLVVNALGGNDRVTEQFPTTTQPLYGTSTIDGGTGDDVLTGAFRSDVLIGGPGADVLDGGLGDDQLLAADGQADTLHGGLGSDTAQRDAADTVDGVETDTPQVGRAHLASKTARAHVGETTALGVIWTHPTSWRRLKMVALKAFDGDQPVGEVYVRMRDGWMTGEGALALVPGASRLTRHGRTATTKLAVRVPRSLAGKSLRLDVEAADRDGHLQLISGAGLLKVAG